MAGNGSHLPEKENIGPNQCSWPETAMRMGVKRVNKHPNSKVNSVLMAQHIGEPNHKHTADDNPYGAGEQSGKQAKPDTCSAAANVRAHAAEEWAEPLPASQPSPMSFPLPVSLPMPAPSMHAPIYYHSHPPLSQPVYSHYQGAPMAPLYYPPFASYSFPPPQM